MKVDKRRPGDCDPTLMNARRKEKKKLIQFGRKPTLPSEWVSLGDALVTWSKLDSSMNIDTFALTRNYGPCSFSKWCSENTYFADCYEIATYNVGIRRLTLLQDQDKLIQRTLPLYDWRLAEYERSLKQKEQEMKKEDMKNAFTDSLMDIFPENKK